MRWIGDLWFRIRALFTKDELERGLSEEFEFHLDMEARKHEASGMTPAQARREARLRFGGEDRSAEQVRRAWGVGAVTDLGADVRFARRQLFKNPAFTVLAVLTLALGIGGTVALFSVVNGLMLRPLPYPDEDRIVQFWSDFNWRGEEFDLVKDIPRSFEGVAAYSNNAYTLRLHDATSLILATVASAELFDVLGARPLLGRTFQPGDDRPGTEPVVVLTHGLWQTEFGADPQILGRRINLSGVQTTVVGVMPDGFYFPSPEMQAFIPLELGPDVPGYANNGWLVLTGRLLPGTTEAQVQDDLTLITQALGDRYDYPERWDKTRNPFVTPVREVLFGDVRPALLLLLAAVGLLLLMACVNVAALILTKTVDRTREMSVRAALGAGRGRLARQILTESVLLGTVAGVVGMALAVALFDVLVASLPIDPAFRETLGLDWFTLLSALALSVVSGCLIALLPMRNLLRGELADGALTDRSGSGQAHVGKMQQFLVVAEVLLAVVLVTGATLLVRTVGELRSLDPGFETDRALAVGVLVSEEETTPEERALFFEELQRRAKALPGVTHAGFINRLPLRDGGFQGSITIPDRPDLADANRPNAMFRPVTPETFDALGIDIVQGRGFLPSDAAGSQPVAVISESFATRIWGDQSPLGRIYENGWGEEVEVVGVVEEIAVTDLVGASPMVGYYPWDQFQRGEEFGVLVLRTELDPASLAAPARTLIKELEPRAALARVQTLSEVLDAEMVEPLRLRFFLGLFAILGLVLGTVGVYGVVSYSVERRRMEYGIRMALGAAPGRVLGDVVRSAMLPVVGGVIVGTVVALLAARTLAGFLFGVTPTDPASLFAAGGGLLLAGVLAALIPALRASATQPATALRAD